MSIPGWHDWPMWTIAAALALLGAVTLALGVYWDRPRGRRRCPRCWYDMTGLPGLTCPECGRTARSERRLRRTRRKRRIIALGVLLLLASCVPTRLRDVQRRGWPAALPDPALFALMPLGARESTWRKSYSGDGLGYDLHREINARLSRPIGPHIPRSEHRFSLVDRHILAWLCLTLGDPERLTWNQDLYAATLGSLAAADALPSRAWPIIWQRTADTSIWCRDRWPRGVPIRVTIHTPSWFRAPFPTGASPGPTRRITFERTADPHARYEATLTPQSYVIGCGAGPLIWDDNTVALGPGEHPLSARVTLEQLPDSAEADTLWTGATRIPTTLVPTIDDAIAIVRDGATDAVLARAMHLVLQDGQAHLWMTATPEIDTSTLTLGLRIRFLHRGEEVAHASFWTRAYIEGPDPQPVAMGVPIDGDAAAALAADLANDPDWQVEIAADPVMALRDLRSDRCWGGSFLLPRGQITIRADDGLESRIAPPLIAPNSEHSPTPHSTLASPQG